jgi:hypothetical protein
MIQVKSFTPEIDLEILWRFEDRSMGQGRPSIASQKLATKLLPEVISLVKPVAYVGFFPVLGSNKRCLELENGLALTGGFVDHILGGAQEIAVIVCTIGPTLEEHAKEYFGRGHPARGYLLDALGIVALGNLAEDARRYTEEQINQRGLQASTPISPGHADWALSEQKILFELVPTGETGVLLNSSYLMQPHKSLSMVLGSPLVKTCTYRRIPSDPWYPSTYPNKEASMKND